MGIRKKGERILVKVWNNLCDWGTVGILLFQVATGTEDRKLRAKLTKNDKLQCSVMAIGLTVVALFICRLSFIWTGCAYSFFSFWRHVSVVLGEASGNWNHLFTGVAFEVMGYHKENLISEKPFASFLNNLASYGILGKFIQLISIIFCIAVMFALLYMLFLCLYRLFKLLLKKDRRKKHNAVRRV